MLHPLEHVRDQQNPLADTTALASRHAPQLDRPRFGAKEVCRHRPFPQTWYANLLTLPHLGISGSWYKIYKMRFQGNINDVTISIALPSTASENPSIMYI